MSAFGTNAPDESQYSKSSQSVRNIQKVCNIPRVMTLGSTSGGLSKPVQGGTIAVATPWSQPLPLIAGWYVCAVAIVRAGKPLESLRGLWQLQR